MEAGWLALALLVPVTFQRWSYDAFELPKQSVTLVVTQTALLGALAAWLASAPPAGHDPWRRRLVSWLGARPGVLAALGVALAWLLAAAASVAPEQSWWGLPPRWAGARAQLAHAALLAIASCTVRRPAQLVRLAAATSLAASVAAGYAILQRIGRDPFEWGGYLGATAAADLSSRPPGTFGNPNFLAGYLALSLFLTLGAVLSARRTTVRGALAISLSVQAAALALTQTRGAWLGTLAGGAVFATALAALYRRGWRRWLIGAAILLALTLVALRLVQPVLPAGTLLSRAASIVSPAEATASIRLTLWRLVGAAWLARPLTGFGPDAIAPVFQRAYGAELVAAEGALGGQSQYDRAENAAIDTLLAAGVLGGLALLATGLVVARSVERLVNARDLSRVFDGDTAFRPQPLVAGLVAALVAHLTAQQFNVEVVGASFLAWLIAGALIGLSADAGRPAANGDVRRPSPSGRWKWLAGAGGAGAAVALSIALAWSELRPLRAGLAYEGGLVLQRAGRPADAVPLLARANALWPHYYLFWAELAYANRAAARAAPAGPDREQQFREALAAVDRALQANAAHPLVWSYWGDVAGEVAVATSDATLRARARAAHVRATDLAPFWWRYWQNAGDTDMLVGDFAVAKERFARAAALSPRNWVLWASLGDAASRAGDKQTARSAYERALALTAGQPAAATVQRALESLGPPG